MFKSREEAAEKLASHLEKYKSNPSAVVVALPRGGVVLGAILAHELQLPLDVICVRKVGSPSNPEYALGAVTEEGVFVSDLENTLDMNELRPLIDKETAEAKRRSKLYRQGMPPRNFTDKTVILVDDGVATGRTLNAALKQLYKEGPHKIVLAIPTAPQEMSLELRQSVDECIILETPTPFYAVGGSYLDFPQVTDNQVIDLMTRQDCAAYDKAMERHKKNDYKTLSHEEMMKKLDVDV